MYRNQAGEMGYVLELVFTNADGEDHSFINTPSLPVMYGNIDPMHSTASHFFMFTIRVLMLFLCYMYQMLCPCCLHFPLSSGILLPLQVQFIKMNDEKGKPGGEEFLMMKKIGDTKTKNINRCMCSSFV